MNTSRALMILVGSVIAMPGGCETVLAINSDMLRATPLKDMKIPKRPMNIPVPRNQKPTLRFGLK